MTRVSKFRFVIFLVAAVLLGFGSYSVGFSGLSPAEYIKQSRCEAGAFIQHAPAPKEGPGADAQTDTKSVSVTNQPDPSRLVQAPAQTTGGNLMPNPGVEALTGGTPTGWSNNHYGNNDAAFSQVLGHNSSRALRIDINHYTDGTADWFTDLVNVNPGTYYTYSDFYRSNVPTHVTLMLHTDAGRDQYIPLGPVAASSTWAQYNARFFVPTNVHKILISHTLDRQGSLETDDYSLMQATPGQFKEPLVTVTFDDSWASVHNNALPIMDKYNITSTQYVISGVLGQKGYDSVAQLYDFQKDSHEIASHTIDHKDLTKLSAKDLTKEVTVSQAGLTKCFGPVTDFAAPYGAYNPTTTKAVADSYTTARSTDPGLNSADSLNPYELKVENVRSDTTPEQLQAWLDTAKANHAWLILVYHQVENQPGEYTRSTSQFESDMQKIAASGIPVKTMHDAYAEIAPQVKQ
jgi:peptidoglycan/xylan/chitin deacetylase (PgdA/CDA1 family)